MKALIAFSSDTIEYIHKSIQEFIEDNYNDEMIFFDDIWEIYEDELKKWVGKPSRKWRLRIRKIRLPKVIGMSDGSEAIELVTPKILDVVATTYTYIVRIKEKLTITKVEEILKKCVKKLPESERKETVVFFAPRILRDLQEVEGLPEEEVKKEYVMFTDKNREGIPLTKTEYLENKKRCESHASKYKFIIDEVDYSCFFEGENINESGRELPGKPAWRAFIYLLLLDKEPGKEVNFEEVFKFVHIGKRYVPGKTYQSVEKWISMFRVFLNDELQWFIIGQDESEFIFQEKIQFEYCIFRRLRSIPG